ncbi:type II toxin-antitoxin system VapC family toxin [Sphingobacteriales bacterium CHB3]|nr:type II toxin-antitoxin system VapC family toxin [Sphingobacteriales bacterium CHB3]
MKRYRVYADTSVFGGCFDDEFSYESIKFFEEVAQRKFILVLSSVTLRELNEAPEHVQRTLEKIPADTIEVVDDAEEITLLRDSYIEAGVLGRASADDAEHIAAASVAEADFVVSWNFKHIVHYEKIQGFQAVNLLKGYKPIRIYSPREVVES